MVSLVWHLEERERLQQITPILSRIHKYNDSTDRLLARLPRDLVLPLLLIWFGPFISCRRLLVSCLTYSATTMNDDSGQPCREGARQGKRSRTVCFRCHQKKVRCDLQLVPTTHETRHVRCTPCVDAETSCTLRSSYKGRHRRKRLDAAGAEKMTGNKRGQAPTYLGDTSFLTLFSPDENPPDG